MPPFQPEDGEFGTGGSATDEDTTIGRLPARVNRLRELERAAAQQAAGEVKDDRAQGASVSHGWGGGGPPRDCRFVDQASEHNDFHSHWASGVPDAAE